MKACLCLTLSCLLAISTVHAQAPSATSGAANSGQLAESERPAAQISETREVKIPAGTPLEIEVAYTVSSLDVRPEELISFRVIVPVKVDGLTVIEKSSLVTGRIVVAKRGGHWGKAGKLAWTMRDTVAVDLTRVPLQARNDFAGTQNRVTGTSHGGQVATQMVVMGALLGPFAPVALMQGFKRGENAVLPEGKRFIVFVQTDTLVRVYPEK